MASAPKKTPAPAAAPAPVAAAPAAAAPAAALEAAVAPMKDIQDTMRDAAEKGVADARVAFERLRESAEETSAAIEASAKTAAEGAQGFNLKLVEAMRVNAEANFGLMKAMLGAKSLSEAISLNAEFARTSFDTLSAQSKDLSESAQKIAQDAFAPLRETLNKAFNKAA